MTNAIDDEYDLALRVPAFGEFLFEEIITFIILIISATLPWPERVKRSIQKLEDQREESRREQQIIGQMVLVLSIYLHVYISCRSSS